MSRYNLIKYSGNYSKTSRRLLQYYRDKPAVNDNGAIVEFYAANVTDLFNFI